jgi:hypothetical protein
MRDVGFCVLAIVHAPENISTSSLGGKLPVREVQQDISVAGIP